MVAGPVPKDDRTRDRLRLQRQRDTSAELRLRSILHRAGLRFRVDQRPEQTIRSRADILFRRAKVAVFVDGCFWHSCPQHGTSPKTNHAWWKEKLERNVARDSNTDRALDELGWVVLRFWEHDDPADAADAVLEVLRSETRARGPVQPAVARSARGATADA